LYKLSSSSRPQLAAAKTACGTFGHCTENAHKKPNFRPFCSLEREKPLPSAGSSSNADRPDCDQVVLGRPLGSRKLVDGETGLEWPLLFY
jgi:hypothetical protein